MICVERLHIPSITRTGKSKTLHRNIFDAGWAIFFRYLSDKAESAGRQVIFIETKNTTQTCSQCGTFVPKILGDRIHTCPTCGFVADRDYNASLNIKKRGMEWASSLMEPRPPPRLTTSSGEPER